MQTIARMLRLLLPGVTLAIVLAPTLPAAALVGPSLEMPSQTQVLMVLNRRGGSAGFCTGIVLASDIVMTAAHCVPRGSDVRIHFPVKGAEPVLLPVAEIAIHPNYREEAIRKRERSVDLALIRLGAPLPSNFQPATLATVAGTSIGTRFIFMGYGVGREGNASSSGVLRAIALPTRAPLSDVLLWSADPSGHDAGACTGDSGGPVSAEGSSAIGAIILWSAGAAGHQCGQLTQSLWLAPYRGWIDGLIATWKNRTKP